MPARKRCLCRIFSKTFESETVELYRFEEPTFPNRMVTADRV